MTKGTKEVAETIVFEAVDVGDSDEASNAHNKHADTHKPDHEYKDDNGHHKIWYHTSPKGRKTTLLHTSEEGASGAPLMKLSGNAHHSVSDIKKSQKDYNESYTPNERVNVMPKTISRQDIDIQEDIDAVFQGSDLSEEFKQKATEIFETAVISSVNQKLAQIAEETEKELNEQIASIQEGFTAKLDEYMDYVVEQFMEDNKVAIESGLRAEITENFLTGLRDLFTEHYIEIPESKVDVVDELANRVEELEAAVNEEITRNVDMKQKVEMFEREIAFVEVSEGLTETQIAKFESLAEAVEYSDSETYKQKLETIRQSYFAEQTEVTESNRGLDDEPVGTEELTEAAGPMKVYSEAISRTFKKQ